VATVLRRYAAGTLIALVIERLYSRSQTYINLLIAIVLVKSYMVCRQNALRSKGRRMY